MKKPSPGGKTSKAKPEPASIQHQIGGMKGEAALDSSPSRSPQADRWPREFLGRRVELDKSPIFKGWKK